jgi:propanediol utilization protein
MKTHTMQAHNTHTYTHNTHTHTHTQAFDQAYGQDSGQQKEGHAPYQYNSEENLAIAGWSGLLVCAQMFICLFVCTYT